MTNTRTVYRDRLTGKLVSKKVWQSKKGRTARYGGGYKGQKGTKRYVKEQIAIPEGRPQSFLVTSSNDSANKSFDFETVATTREDAIRYTQAELEDRHGRFSARALQEHWGWKWSAIRFEPPEYHDENSLGEVEDR